MHPDDGTLGIGELAHRTGVSVRSLRYYEQRGLLPATRTPAGHRRFGEGTVEAVRRIRLLLEAGLPLAVVAKITPCFADRGRSLDACVAGYLRDHLGAVEERIQELDRQRRAIARLRRMMIA